MSNASTDQSNAVRGAVYMASASILIAISAACVRQLSGEFSAFQIVFLRAVVGSALLAPWMVRMGRHGTLATTRFPMYLLRSAFSYTGMVCVFYGIGHMPIGEVYSLLFLVPLITVMLATLILKERATVQSWIACGVGFAGALVILRPGVIDVSLAAAAVLVTAVTYAATNICIKSLSRTDTPVQITIYGNLLLLVFSSIPAIALWHMPVGMDYAWIALLGVSQLLAALFHARAVHAADARVVQPFNFLRLPVSVLVAYWLFAELPSHWTWLGAAMIFAGSYYALYAERGKRRRMRDS